MTRPNSALILTAMLLVSACAQKQYSMPPEGRDVATIEFPVEPEMHDIVKNEGYGYVYVYLDSEECSNRQQFRVPPGSSSVVGRVPAGEPITFSRTTDTTFTGNLALFDYSGTMCRSMFTMTPEAGERYTVSIPKIATGCKIQVTDKNGHPVPITIRELREGLTGAWCEPL